MHKEPQYVIPKLSDTLLLQHGLNKGEPYKVKSQHRPASDNSKIVYIFNPNDPQGKAVICLLEGEYKPCKDPNAKA